MRENSEDNRVKVVLVNPPRHGGIPVVREERHEFRLAQTVQYPLSLMHVAAQLESRGHEAVLIDANAEDLSHESLAQRVVNAAPDLVGIRVALDGACSDLAFVPALRRHRPDLPVIARSRLVALGRLEEAFLARFAEVDAVATGELEAVIPQAAETLAAGGDPWAVEGVYVRGSASFHRDARVADWREIPLPAYHLLGDLGRYGRLNRSRRRVVGQLESSRGCPYACSFCIQARTPWRAKPAEQVCHEMETLSSRYQVRHIQFQDDTFTVNSSRVEALCELAARSGPLREVTWECNARVDTVTLPLLRAMRRAGCRRIHFGVESLRDDVLASIGKGIDADTTERAVRAAWKAGISAGAAVILGLPGDTAEGILATARRLARLPLAGCQFTLALPYAGTLLHEEARRNGWLEATELDWSRLDQTLPTVRHPDLSPASLLSLRRRCYRVYYRHPMRAIVGLSMVRGLGDFDDLTRRALNLASKFMRDFRFNR